jgi:hypothetical protein
MIGDYDAVKLQQRFSDGDRFCHETSRPSSPSSHDRGVSNDQNTGVSNTTSSRGTETIWADPTEKRFDAWGKPPALPRFGFVVVDVRWPFSIVYPKGHPPASRVVHALRAPHAASVFDRLVE